MHWILLLYFIRYCFDNSMTTLIEVACIWCCWIFNESLFCWLPKLHTLVVKLDKEYDPNIPRMDESRQVHRILKTTLSQGKLGGKPGVPLLSYRAGQFHIGGGFLCYLLRWISWLPKERAAEETEKWRDILQYPGQDSYQLLTNKVSLSSLSKQCDINQIPDVTDWLRLVIDRHSKLENGTLIKCNINNLGTFTHLVHTVP